jgi:hypothetical protein
MSNLISCVLLDYAGAANPATPPSLRTLTVPQGVKVVARLFFDSVNSTGTGGYVAAWDADLGAAANSHLVMLRLTGASENGLRLQVMTSANRQIYTYENASSGTSTLTVRTLGWIDPCEASWNMTSRFSERR